MAPRTMHDPMDDVTKQAHQGSVAAIIQTLNEHLSETGIRIRAVFTNGVLQLLCEAAMPEQLEQSLVVAQIKQTLEGIAPRNIHRVNINSRIVQEQQLLWWEEISRDPENQLLWSQEIILAKPNLFKQLVKKIKHRQPAPSKQSKLSTLSSLKRRRDNQFWGGIFSGVSLSLLLMIIGWSLYNRLGLKFHWPMETPASHSTASSSPMSVNSPPLAPSPINDPFTEAVKLAQQTAAAGKTAQTAAEWLDLAAKWEHASDLMGRVKPYDQRYQIAQDRVQMYHQNSQAAQKQASRRRSK
ncbi:MAG: hypothetical protein F6J89_00800 [Symploca sp. SIO1C4]|uniref:Uncharacterized protein n=1 Tax=Symploca sp. SIO1C4 TaxID=2607765 RepID=A0A6B3N9E0_9CYAN|nr:hypothetical protein [Symploca sp. SIO1C4]